MSIAEKFRKTLSTRDIFVQPEKETEPVTDVIDNDTDSDIPTLTITQEPRTNKFTDLANETLQKIHNTPFWEEYTMQAQEKMISRYFDAKVRRSPYASVKYSLVDKLSFIEDVLKSSQVK